MPMEGVLTLGLLGLAVVLLVVLLLRRPAPDAAAQQAMAGLQAALGQQAAQLGALDGGIRAELARHAGDLERVIAGFTLEQTRLLNEGLRAHDARLDALEKALDTRLDAAAAAAREAQEKQREALARGFAEAAEAAAALRTALAAQLTEAADAARDRQEMQRTALAKGITDLTPLLEAARVALAAQLTEATDAARLRQEAQRAALDQGIAAQALATEALRGVLAEGQTKLGAQLAQEMLAARELIDRKAEESRAMVEAKLRELREANDIKLAELQRTVNEQLASAVEKQMNESFNRVIDQFTAIQQMMGNVQAVASQVGDLKRLFGNVKARGGWGEAQVRALLEDILPVGTWEANVRLREDSQDVVEFAVTMPSSGGARAVLPIDAKFPTEDYDRLLLAGDAADADGERAARAALERRIRLEAAKIAAKYIIPPRTVEFAVLYLPNDGLYAEVARIPGLTDEIGRTHRVFVLGPALLPAMLRTIQLGHVTLALSANAEGVRDLLAATRGEMQKMDAVLTSLGKQVGTVSNTIGRAQTRTRAINRKLRGVDVMAAPAAEALLELTAEDPMDEEEA